jgi:nucleotide-binding universal stress UspA family protein
MAESALPVAAMLARRSNASLTLVHVIERNAPAVVHSERHLVDAQEAGAYLEALAARPGLAGLRVDTHVHTAEVRDVARSITDHTEELAPDLIVLTTHGRGGARRLFSGAMAQQVVGRVTTPVLLVHPPAGGGGAAAGAAAGAATGGAAGAATGGAAEVPWTRILAPTDGRPDHEPGVEVAADLARVLSCALHLLVVTPTTATLGGTEHAMETLLPGATRIQLEMQNDAAEAYLAARASELAARGIQAHGEASRGDPARAIIKAAKRIDPDLVVLATHGRAGADAFFEGSVAARVVARAHAPLLLVPLKE